MFVRSFDFTSRNAVNVIYLCIILTAFPGVKPLNSHQFSDQVPITINNQTIIFSAVVSIILRLFFFLLLLMNEN